MWCASFLLTLSLLIPILVGLLCSGFHFGKSVLKKWFRWDVWAFTTRWRYMGVGVRCLVLLMWLFCIWSVGYAVLPIIQWFDPLHPGSPHDTSRLLYSSSVSKCHNQLPYSHSGLWGMLLYVSENLFLFKCNCLPFRPSCKLNAGWCYIVLTVKFSYHTAAFNLSSCEESAADGWHSQC